MEGNDKLPEEPKLKYPLVLVSWYDAKDGSSGWVKSIIYLKNDYKENA